MITDDIKKMKRIVEKIMQKHPETRNSDTILIFKVLKELGCIEYNTEGYIIKYVDLYKIPSFESITRVRRKIQNDEKRLLPTDEKVLRQRGMLKEEMKEIHKWYGNGW